MVVGLDFSIGMLKVATRKIADLENVYVLQAEAGGLPFKAGVFHAVTCSHAFYELKGESQDRCLQEVVRVLTPSGAFYMMEHDIPKSVVIRMLYYIRLLSMGASKAIEILKHEKAYLGLYFKTVTTIRPPRGLSKIMICKNQ